MSNQKNYSDAEKTLLSHLEYYDGQDFQEGYYISLIEDIEEHGAEQLSNIINISDDDAIKSIDNDMQAKIITHVIENIDMYASVYCSYYTGDNCIGAVSYGEQEEETVIDFNEDTDDDMGFYIVIGNDYMYYEMSSNGVCVILNEDTIKSIVNEIEN
jgi:hypothetical protein